MAAFLHFRTAGRERPGAGILPFPPALAVRLAATI